jgi:hypothetical protein
MSVKRRLDSVSEQLLHGDPVLIEQTLTEMSRARGAARPLAWLTGGLIVFLAGLRQMLATWRLLPLELIPSAWIWFATWDLKVHFLRNEPLHLRHSHVWLPWTVVLIVMSIIVTWCNGAFAFGLSYPGEGAANLRRRTGREWKFLTLVGFVSGLVVSFGVIVSPHFGLWWFGIVMTGVVISQVILFVAVPARLLGRQQRRPSLRQRLPELVIGTFVSAVAMAPGFTLNRVGLLLLGSKPWRPLGFVIMAVGSALYAASVTSVKAVKLSTRLVVGPGLLSV